MSDTARLELQWSSDEYQTITYCLYSVDSSGQYSFLGSFNQGPFDTALEVAQWAWRTLAKRLPPSAR